MNAKGQQGRKPRADVQRNRTALLEAAQRHFLRDGVGTSLEAVAKDAGVGPGTLYRHFPTREALLAAVLQSRTAELEARREAIAGISDVGEALAQWLRAMEDYLSAYSGLPEPLMAAARAQDPDNPLTVPCGELIATTETHARTAQRAGYLRPSVTGHDLFLGACSVAWIKGTGTAEEAVERLRSLIAHGYREPGDRA
ncbi:TetR/AcrR family transcriptional regulator [Streptomyces flaveolus]|uniref:TetR/AcrR family transcriptional regulator n=1 Tax=Streptomyces flaveolus TaxID=67297 RepID=UPI0017AFCF37|nr:TetR/AcrR family transcriptional regulator [Streptomyces sp.]